MYVECVVASLWLCAGVRRMCRCIIMTADVRGMCCCMRPICSRNHAQYGCCLLSLVSHVCGRHCTTRHAVNSPNMYISQVPPGQGPDDHPDGAPAQPDLYTRIPHCILRRAAAVHQLACHPGRLSSQGHLRYCRGMLHTLFQSTQRPPPTSSR